MKMVMTLLTAALAGCVNLSAPEAKITLRAGTVNVRYPNKGDDKAGDGWDARKGDLMDLMRRLDMDVVGLQEVHPKPSDDLVAGMSEWEIIRDYGITPQLAYRKSRFDLLDKGTFWLSETPEVPHSISWGAAHTHPCTWLILKDKATGREFCFANTHTDYKSELARLNGIKLVLARMKDFSRGLPVIFVGDHNCGPMTPPSIAAREVLKDARDIAEAKDPGPINTFHAWGKIKDVDWRRCDYIYVSDGIRVKDFVTHDDKRPGLDRYPTDHYPCTATLEF